MDAARLRGESWRAGGLREYARRVGRTASADAVGDGEIGVFPNVRRYIAMQIQDEDNARAAER